MSDSLTITADTGETFTRQSRRDRPERQREPDGPTVSIEGAGDTITPEAALADSREQLQAKDRQVADARRIARDADQRRVAAEAEVQRARETQVVDRQSVVAQAMETAKAEQSAARIALRTAQETGDAEAMASAVEALSGATYRFSQANGELDHLKAMPKPQARPPQQQSGRSTDAQRWLDEHPRFETDRKYRGVAIDAHNEAIAKGNREGSREYVDYIDRVMTDEFGEGHGRDDNDGHQQEPVRRSMPEPRNNRQGSTAVPPSRQSSQASGGYKTVRTPLGDLLVQDRSDGTRGIRFPNAKVQSDFEEGAMLDKRASHSPEDFKKALAEYANEQVNIAHEIAAGGSGDLVVGDGRSFT